MSADLQFMSYAARLALRGCGSTSPNPSVGALIVAKRAGGASTIVGCGWTQPGGRPHAETMALGEAGSEVRGATLYVTLEPCAHHGKTPPCTEAIIEAGIARVVSAYRDPDPRVAGKGFCQLRDAGIQVDADIGRAAAWAASAGHIWRHRKGRPYITAKLAVGSDGRISVGDGAPVWVTGPVARAHGHLMRARADAILVGGRTVEADDPSLTCRLSGLESRSPLRVVIDSALRHFNASRKLAMTARDVPTMVFVGEGVGREAIDHLEGLGVVVNMCQTGASGHCRLANIFEALATQGTTRVLVEGGPTLIARCLERGLVDEVILYRGGEAASDPAIDVLHGRGFGELSRTDVWCGEAHRKLGGDVMQRYVRRDVCQVIAGAGGA